MPMARPHAPRGQGRVRVIDAAMDLFAEHGVSGTSLQMIAEHLGVTKAAVYYQFHAKEDIVLAVLESALAEMADFLTEAEGAATARERSDRALVGLVDLMMRHRQAMATMLRDPEAGRIVESHPAFRSLSDRLAALLLGPHPDTRQRVAVSLVGSGLAQAGIDPHLVDLEDEQLRGEMLAVARAALTGTSSAAP